MAKRYVKTISLPNGKRKYIYGNTKEELEKKYAQARLEVCAGVDISDNTTFGEFAQMWYNTFKKGKVQPQTERIIKSNINNNLMPVLATVELRKITPMLCKQVFIKMDERDINIVTQRTVLGILKNIMDCAVDNNILLKSPVTKSVQPGGKKVNKKEAISSVDSANLLEHMKQYGDLYYSMTHVALHTALRVGELMALKWSDIDLTDRVLHVRSTLVQDTAGKYNRQEHTKTVSGMRDVPYGDSVASVIAMMKLKSTCDYVFSLDGKTHLRPADYKKFCVRLKAYDEKITPHTLRHTAITNWIVDKGIDPKTAQYLAGHSDVSITYNIYTSYVKEEKFKETAELIRSFG